MAPLLLLCAAFYPATQMQSCPPPTELSVYTSTSNFLKCAGLKLHCWLRDEKPRLTSKRAWKKESCRAFASFLVAFSLICSVWTSQIATQQAW
ncbi:uncharacterized protein BDW70DRAFT_137408 [Aspergillus foveolatus]|uniref:uncharacterized protein n=1 Tax=Aspergillus foveolatus TaxID=210207 RepID=UPI003CCD94E1